MARKTLIEVMRQWRAKLMKQFGEHEAPQWLKAAEALEPTLLDLAREAAQPKSPNAESVIGPRLARMAHRAITSRPREKAHALARYEVQQHGRGAYASEEAAVYALRMMYRKQAETREAEARALVEIAHRYRVLHASPLSHFTRLRDFVSRWRKTRPN